MYNVQCTRCPNYANATQHPTKLGHSRLPRHACIPHKTHTRTSPTHRRCRITARQRCSALRARIYSTLIFMIVRHTRTHMRQGARAIAVCIISAMARARQARACVPGIRLLRARNVMLVTLTPCDRLNSRRTNAQKTFNNISLCACVCVCFVSKLTHKQTYVRCSPRMFCE